MASSLDSYGRLLHMISPQENQTKSNMLETYPTPKYRYGDLLIQPYKYCTNMATLYPRKHVNHAPRLYND